MFETKLEKQAGRICLTLQCKQIGKDFLVCITGGDVHIGAAAVGTNLGELPSSSVITVPGHRDDEIALKAARNLTKALQTNITVIAGVHFDKITPAEITQSLILCDELILALINEIKLLKLNKSQTC